MKPGRELFDFIAAQGAQLGLNLVAAIPAQRYDQAVPAAAQVQTWAPNVRSVVVLANGGGDFWRAFQDHLAIHPDWEHRPNPLDDFTAAMVERRLVGPLAAEGIRCQAAYPFMGQGPTLHFMQLGLSAGLAGPSLVGVVVNPVYGPWIAFRAALLLEALLDYPGPAIGFDPCPTCTAKSCIAACPTAAVEDGRGWNVHKCLRYRVETEADCADRCHARVACVLAPEMRYPEDELRYHQRRALAAMRPYYQAQRKQSES